MCGCQCILSNEIFCVHYFYTRNPVLCVPTVPNQQNEFYSTTTGTGKLQEAHTLFLYTMWMLVHCNQPIWYCCLHKTLQSFQMRYFVFISDQKSCCLCACNKSIMNFIQQPNEQKSSRRQTQCSNTLIGCLCT